MNRMRTNSYLVKPLGIVVGGPLDTTECHRLQLFNLAHRTRRHSLMDPFAFATVDWSAYSPMSGSVHPKFLNSPRMEEGIARLVLSAKSYLASRGVDVEGLPDQAILMMQRQHKWHERSEKGRRTREAKRPPL